MLNISEQFVVDYFMANAWLSEITESMDLILKYKQTDHYKSKNQRLAEWIWHTEDILNLIVSIFTVTLLEQSTTYQAMIGRLSHKIKVKDSIDRFKILADIIGLISQTGLIDIDSPGQGQHINISTLYDMEVDIPVEERHVIVTDRPQPIEMNKDSIHGSMLMGHRMNHHNDEICLHHLNRLNQIPLQLNKAFVNAYTETPKNEPKTQQTKDQWRQFMKESFGKYQEILKHKKPFYLIHKYDTRGRTYACGYHVTSQGNSYKKAIVELANEELII